MRAILTAALVAGVILVGYFLTSDDDGRRPPSSGDSFERGPLGPAATGADWGSSAEESGPAPIPFSGGDNLPRPPRDLREYAENRGLTGKAVMSILERMKGSDVPPLDRSFGHNHISKILNAWLRDPSRQSADLEFLVYAWNEVDDPAFRWAMSWLMQRAPDDRMVGPLLELLSIDPGRMVEAVAGVGTPLAIESLSEILAQVPKTEPGVRAKIATRVAQSRWEGRLDHLREAWTDAARPAAERIAAIEGLCHLQGEEGAQRMTLDLALGPQMPLTGSLLGREISHPERDLRSAAVQALIVGGNEDSLRELLRAVDVPSGDTALRTMIERHVCAFQGPDVAPLLIDRAMGQQRVPYGVAQYINRIARRDLIPRIEALIPLAQDQPTRELLEAALLNARAR